MFDNLITGEDKPSATDVLLKLLDSDEKDRKTNVLMPHIKMLIINRRLSLKKQFPQLSIIERDEMVLEYYKDLKTSEKAMAWEKIVEGIKEMKPQLMEANIQEGMMKK